MKEKKHQDLLAALKLRVGFPKSSITSLHDLEMLRSAFSVTVPYENLSTLRDDSISLKPVDVLKKFSKKRGGYCFELNTAFGLLLAECGFTPNMHLGRVWLRNPEQTPPRNHGTNVIEIKGKRYIIDVGFGARAPRCLIPLFDFGSKIDDGDALNEPVRVMENCDFGVMIQRRIGGIWSNQYSLELTPAYSSDIDVANHFQASAPTSHFRHHLFVGRFTAKGRDGLFDNQLTRRTGANTEVQLIQSIEEMCSVLKNVFNIDPIGFENSLEVIIKRET